jgi:O-acetyl-ADP-ribose deacetylase (regulator of RNase III)
MLMAVSYVAGDLFANAYSARAFAHGCNCKGSMGAGIAVGFRERYPDMYEEYRRRCKATPRQLNPGDVFLWKAEGTPWVFNLATQEDYWRSRATYEAMEQVLATMRAQSDAEGIRTIAIPRIGTGYGGLSWKKVRAIVERIFSDWEGMVYVYEEYVPASGDGQQTADA